MQPAVLITGAAKRLGRHTAHSLAAAGYDIAVHYQHSKAEAESLADEIKHLGRQAALIQADLTDTHALPDVIAEAKTALPHLGALINNASQFEPASFAETTPDILQANLAIHVPAPFFLSQAFAAQVGKGAIIHFLDSFIRRQSDRYFPYLLSKKALAELTLSMAHSLGPEIRVNAIAPGIILPSGPFDEKYLNKRKAEAPLQRLATPDDIAQGVKLLLETPSLTGQILWLDGGEHVT